MNYEINPDECEHSGIDWDGTSEENYNESKAIYGQCNQCGTKLIELWDYAGVYKRDENNEPIGDRI